MVVKFHERGQPTEVPIKPPGWDSLLMRGESFVELAEDRDNVSEWGNRLLFQ